jgi:hypothetical protein
VLEVPQELMLTRVAKNKVRNLVAESLRFPVVKLICSGLVGPKSRPKGVDDGYQVNIPEL